MWNFLQDVIRPLKRNQTGLITQWNIWNSSVEYFRNPEGVLRQSKHAVKWSCCRASQWKRPKACRKAAAQLNRIRSSNGRSVVEVRCTKKQQLRAREVKTWQETDLQYVSLPSYLWASQNGNLYKSGCGSCSHYTFVKALDCKLKVCPLSIYLFLNPLWYDLLWHSSLANLQSLGSLWHFKALHACVVFLCNPLLTGWRGSRVPSHWETGKHIWLKCPLYSSVNTLQTIVAKAFQQLHLKTTETGIAV